VPPNPVRDRRDFTRLAISAVGAAATYAPRYAFLIRSSLTSSARVPESAILPEAVPRLAHCRLGDHFLMEDEFRENLLD
jgi:hypothetical protein